MRRPLKPLALWAMLRLLTIAVAALAFAHHQPPVQRPQDVTPVPDRLAEQIVVAPWYNYDAVWYVKIVRDGYAAGDGTTNFHPLYLWTARLLRLPGLHPLWPLLIVSTCAGAVLTIVFQRLAALDLSDDGARAAVNLFLCWPASLVIFAPYTEALWLLLAIASIYCARTDRWWTAGLLGGLASMTRQQGVLLSFPLIIEAVRGTSWQAMRVAWRRWAALALVPLGYVAWVGIRALLLDDFALSLASPNAFLFSVMISPSSRSVVGDSAFLPPWEAIGKAFAYFQHGGHPSAWLDAALAVAFILMLIVAWPKMRTSYRVYAAIVVLVSLSFHTGAVTPYMSLPRHLLLAFPVFVGFTARYRFRNPLLLGSAGCAIQLMLLCAFVWNLWIP